LGEEGLRKGQPAGRPYGAGGRGKQIGVFVDEVGWLGVPVEGRASKNSFGHARLGVGCIEGEMSGFACHLPDVYLMCRFLRRYMP